MICLDACHKAILMKTTMMMMSVLRYLGVENSQVVVQKVVIACLQRDKRQKNPLDIFFTPKPANIVKAHKEGRGQGRQKTLNEMCRKKLRDKVCKDIARLFYDGGIPFHLLKLDSFHVMCESIG